MYSVLDYGAMARDGARMNAYAGAIAAVVKPGMVVVDLGAGTGIHSLLAAKAGARIVHAIEPNPAVWLLRDIAHASGLGSQIEIHQSRASEVSLTEQADVLICDLRGSYPLFGPNLAVVRDAKKRFLKRDGILVPDHDRLLVAGVESERMHGDLAAASFAFERNGFDGSAAKLSVKNSVHYDRGKPMLWTDVATTSAEFARVDWGGDQESIFEGRVALVTTRRATIHGLASWFEARVHGELGYGNPPGSSPHVCARVHAVAGADRGRVGREARCLDSHRSHGRSLGLGDALRSDFVPSEHVPRLTHVAGGVAPSLEATRADLEYRRAPDAAHALPGRRRARSIGTIGETLVEEKLTDDPTDEVREIVRRAIRV